MKREEGFLLGFNNRGEEDSDGYVFRSIPVNGCSWVSTKSRENSILLAHVFSNIYEKCADTLILEQMMKEREGRRGQYWKGLHPLHCCHVGPSLDTSFNFPILSAMASMALVNLSVFVYICIYMYICIVYLLRSNNTRSWICFCFPFTWFCFLLSSICTVVASHISNYRWQWLYGLWTLYRTRGVKRTKILELNLYLASWKLVQMHSTLVS